MWQVQLIMSRILNISIPAVNEHGVGAVCICGDPVVDLLDRLDEADKSGGVMGHPHVGPRLVVELVNRSSLVPLMLYKKK